MPKSIPPQPVKIRSIVQSGIWTLSDLQSMSSAPDGSSSQKAAKNGYQLKQDYPNLPSGHYWIQSNSMPNPLQMYVDMTTEGGGYDYYIVSSGTSIGSVNGTHSGKVLGLDLIYPRSKQHWLSMQAFVNTTADTNLNNYFNSTGASGHVGAVYRTTTNTAGTSAGVYTSQIMRDPNYYGTGAYDWRVPDGGRWWLRDTTFTEPNGDYTAYNFLGGYTLAVPYIGADLSFNDVSGQNYVTGTKYLVSTNAKP